MPDKVVLHVCHLRDGSVPQHACRRAANALRAAGHDFDMVVAGRGRPFGLFTTGRRPELKQLSGQEKLPVLVLRDGNVISGSGQIIEWARANPPVADDAGEAGGEPAQDGPPGHPTAEERPAGEPPAGEPPAGEPPAGEPPAGEPPAG